jgi:hypothetical protein
MEENLEYWKSKVVVTWLRFGYGLILYLYGKEPWVRKESMI